jgi:hypothetical protein
MARGSAVRNRSESVTVGTPRGPVEVGRQQVRGLRRNSGWTWFWMARRAGNVDWHEATTSPRRSAGRSCCQRASRPCGCARPLPGGGTAARRPSTRGRRHQRRRLRVAILSRATKSVAVSLERWAASSPQPYRQLTSPPSRVLADDERTSPAGLGARPDGGHHDHRAAFRTTPANRDLVQTSTAVSTSAAGRACGGGTRTSSRTPTSSSTSRRAPRRTSRRVPIPSPIRPNAGGCCPESSPESDARARLKTGSITARSSRWNCSGAKTRRRARAVGRIRTRRHERRSISR